MPVEERPRSGQRQGRTFHRVVERRLVDDDERPLGGELRADVLRRDVTHPAFQIAGPGRATRIEPSISGGTTSRLEMVVRSEQPHRLA